MNSQKNSLKKEKQQKEKNLQKENKSVVCNMDS